MAVKPILKIEIDDSAFVKFKEEFDKHTEDVDASAKSWQNINNYIVNIKDSFNELNKESTRTTSIWDKIENTTGRVFKNIERATASLMRWAGITSLVSGFFGGLLGIGGLFGMSRLANSAYSQSRTAGGFNSTPGGIGAFNLAYGRYFNPMSVLGGVQGAQTDLSKRWILSQLGIRGNPSGLDTAGLASDILPAVKRIFEQRGGTAQGAESAGLFDLGFSMQDLIRLQRTSYAELQEQANQRRRLAKEFELDTGTQKAWTNFHTQLTRASMSLENTFIRGLTNLTIPLGRLSNSFVHLVEVFLKSPLVEKAIDWIAKKLTDFASWLSGPEVEKDVNTFIENLEKLGEKLGKAFDYIGTWVDWLVSKNAPSGPGSDPDIYKRTQTGPGTSVGEIAGTMFWQWLKKLVPVPADGFSPISSAHAGTLPPGFANLNAGVGGRGNTMFNGIEGQAGLPQGLLWNVYGRESSYGTHPGTSSAGAQGPFQFMPDTWRQYGGGGNVQDTPTAARAAARYLSYLFRRFGSWDKAVAAYNWGEGHLQHELAWAQQTGKDWRDGLPAETRGYVESTIYGRDAHNPQQVVIRVENVTGGSATVTTRQLQQVPG